LYQARFVHISRDEPGVAALTYLPHHKGGLLNPKGRRRVVKVATNAKTIMLAELGILKALCLF
jgi:hypothetical protein